MPPPKNHTELNWNPPQVSRAATIPETEWEKHRILITGLHRNGRTLEDIMSIVRQHCIQQGLSFDPTRKQYISRFKKWGLRKYGVQEPTTEASSIDVSATPIGSNTAQQNKGAPDHIDYDDSTVTEDKIWWPLNDARLPGLGHEDESSGIHDTTGLSISSPLINKRVTKTLQGLPSLPAFNRSPQSTALSDLSPASGLGEDSCEATECSVSPENSNTDDGVPKVTLVVLGAQGVGKSTFIRNCYERRLPDSSAVFKKMSLDGVVYRFRLLEMPLDDTILTNGNQIKWPESYNGVTRLSVDGVFILCDVTNRTSVQLIPVIMLALQKSSLPHLTVLCKCDVQPPERQFERGNHLRLPITGLGMREISASNLKSQIQCISTMLRAIFARPKSANSLRHESATRETSDCYKSQCLWCEPALLLDETDEWRPNAIHKTRLSRRECKWKVALADFYFSARSYDDAWRMYEEALCRSQELSCLERMLVAARLMKSSVTLPQYLTARRKLASLPLSDKDNAMQYSELPWLMHTRLGVARHAEGDIDRAVQHLQSATEQCFNATSVSNYGRDICAHQTLVVEVTQSLRRKTAEVNKGLPFVSYDVSEYGAVLCREGRLPILLKWCLSQVEFGGYGFLLGSSCDKPWTKAPNLMALEDFENSSLFCFLWQKYRDAGKERWQEAPSLEETIVCLVERLEHSLQIPAPMIFSTVSSMKSDVETASFPTTYLDIGLEKVAQRALVRLTRLSEIGQMTLKKDDLGAQAGTYLANMFFETYASFNREIEAIEPQEREYRFSVQNFVRHIALRQLPSSAFDFLPGHTVRPRESYPWKTPFLSAAESMGVEELDNGVEPLPELSRSISLSAGSQLVAAVPDQQSDKRPQSLASVNMSSTPRSSFTSSKASLRAMHRLTVVAQTLIKRGGSGEGQLPSEVMDRDSHSSWSLRRFTGVSYLSVSTEMTADGSSEQDAIMTDAPFSA